MTERELQELKAKNPALKERIERVEFRTPVRREFIPVVGDEKALVEDAIQAGVFSWILHPDNRALMPELDLIYAIPNGGKRTKFEAHLFQQTGVRRGIPDIHVAVSRKPFFSLYIELKTWKRFNTKHHGCSPEQLAWHERLRFAGHKVIVSWSVSDTINKIKEYLYGK